MNAETQSAESNQPRTSFVRVPPKRNGGPPPRTCGRKYRGQSCCALFTVAVWLTQGRGQSFEEVKYEEAIARCPVGDRRCR